LTILQPTSLSERHSLLDVLRGFSLLGVLLANMVTHSQYFFLSDAGKEAIGTASTDQYVSWVMHFLVEGKFYSLFSMLFGIGFALQLKRSEELTSDFSSRYRRRLLILFLLGLLHAVFLYVGDILTVYALVGLVLLLFRNVSDKTLVRGAIILLILPVIQYSIFLGAVLMSPPEPVTVSAGEAPPRFFDQLIIIYQTGTFWEIVQTNIGGLIFGRYPDLIFTGRFFRVLAMFLVGFFIARNKLFINVEANRPFIQKVLIMGALVGIPCNIALAMMMETDAYYELLPMGIIQPAVYAFGVPALCLFYAAGITLLYENQMCKKVLTVFAPVGQIALTNYLMQSLICVFIFASYGLGLSAKLGPTKLTVIALVIYTTQAVFSHVWVSYFQFGPMEWIWRSLTYKQWQSFRKSP
jgi:uncharacterized protein